MSNENPSANPPQTITFELGDSVLLDHHGSLWPAKIIGTPAAENYTDQEMAAHRAQYPRYPYDPNDPRLQGPYAFAIKFPLANYVLEFDDPDHTPQNRPIIVLQPSDLYKVKHHNNPQGGKRKSRKMKRKSKKTRKAKRKSRR